MLRFERDVDPLNHIMFHYFRKSRDPPSNNLCTICAILFPRIIVTKSFFPNYYSIYNNIYLNGIFHVKIWLLGVQKPIRIDLIPLHTEF